MAVAGGNAAVLPAGERVVGCKTSLGEPLTPVLSNVAGRFGPPTLKQQ
jgi:hypothetical protein